MAIRPRFNGHLQKNSAMGRVKPTFMSMGLGTGNYPQI